jgi:hypothetical protein
LPACANCQTDFPEAPYRGGKRRVYCARSCQIQAANTRRATTRTGRGVPTNPQPRKPAKAPSLPTLTDIPPSVDMAASDLPRDRLAFLMDKAQSRVGVTPWEVAEIAKLRGISPWAPVLIIIAKEIRK